MFFRRQLIIVVMVQIALGQDSVQITQPLQLKEYTNYADVYINKYDVPDGTDSVFFQFILIASDASCDANASVFVRKGGFPVITPLGELYPENFMNTSAYDFDIPLSTAPQESNVILFFNTPDPGSWFSAAYLNPNPQSAAIKPKGLGSECLFYLKCVVHSSPSTSAIVLIDKEDSFVTESLTNSFRFYVPKNTTAFSIIVTDCQAVNSSGSCQFEIASGVDRVFCNMAAPNACALHRTGVRVTSWYYFTIQAESTLRLSYIVKTQKCDNLTENGPCAVQELIPVTVPFASYMVSFESLDVEDMAIDLSDDSVHISSFHIQALVHSGGTIKYMLRVLQRRDNTYTEFYSCITHNTILLNQTAVKNCSDLHNATIQPTSDVSLLYIPYPAQGIYYVSVLVQCYNSSTKEQTIKCPTTNLVYMNVSLEPCVENKCSTGGKCYIHFSGVIDWSVCSCKNGYRGYGCTDDSQAMSRAKQLTETLLLTLSNLLFLLSVVTAVYRKWFAEALVYFFVLLSSSFYHACDNGTIYALCVLNYSVLKYCDFYGSILAVWVTALALAELPPSVRQFLHMAGCIGIAFATQISLTSVWSFLVPVLLGGVVLTTSWIKICRSERRCHPSAKVLVRQILPGSVCAITGVILYSAFETEENYYYVHSLWHMLMASSIVFLLPAFDKLRLSQIKDFCYKCSSNKPNDVIETADSDAEDDLLNRGHSERISGIPSNSSAGIILP